MLNKIQANRTTLIFIGILLLGAVLRFVNVAKMAPFDFDQEYAANFAYSVLKVYPLQLIGQPLSVEGLFMGPLYFYTLVPFYALTNLHPLGGVIGSIFWGLLIIAAYYWIGSKMFGSIAGLILAYLRAILFSKLQNDWGVVPSMSSEIFILITWYCFYQYWRDNLKLFPLMWFVFGLFTSIHPILFPFYLVFLFLFIIKRKLPNIRLITLSIIAFITPLLPLIVFEFLHNFLEIKRLFEVAGGSSGEAKNLARAISYLQVNLREPNLVLGLSIKPDWLIFAVFTLLVLILALKKIAFWKDNFHKIMLPLTILVFIIYYTFFPTHVPEYYFLAVSVLVLFYTGGIMGLLSKNKLFQPLLILILIYLSIINFKHLWIGWNNDNTSTLLNKDQIVQEILKQQPKNEDFYVSYIRQLGWNFGFNYLFKLYGHTPQTLEAKKPIYTIVIPKHFAENNLNFTSGNIGIIIER